MDYLKEFSQLINKRDLIKCQDLRFSISVCFHSPCDRRHLVRLPLVTLQRRCLCLFFHCFCLSSAIYYSISPCVYLSLCIGSKSHTSVLNPSHFECTSAPGARLDVAETLQMQSTTACALKKKKRSKKIILWDNATLHTLSERRTGDAAGARSQTSKRTKR